MFKVLSWHVMQFAVTVALLDYIVSPESICHAQSAEDVRAANERDRQIKTENWISHPFSIILKQYFESQKDLNPITGNVDIYFESGPVMWGGKFGFLSGKHPARGKFGFDWKHQRLRFDFYFAEGLLSTSDQVHQDVLSTWTPKSGKAFQATESPATAQITSLAAFEDHPGTFSFNYPGLQCEYWPYMLAVTQYRGEIGWVTIEEFQVANGGKSMRVKLLNPHPQAIELLHADGHLQVTRIENQLAVAEIINTRIGFRSVPQKITSRYKDSPYLVRYEFVYDENLDQQLKWDLKIKDGTLVSSKAGKQFIEGGGLLRQTNIDNMIASIQNRDDMELNAVELKKLESSKGLAAWHICVMVALGFVAIVAAFYRKTKRKT